MKLRHFLILAKEWQCQNIVISMNIKEILMSHYPGVGKIILAETPEYFVKTAQTLEFALLFTFSSIMIGGLSLFLYLLGGIFLTEYIL